MAVDTSDLIFTPKVELEYDDATEVDVAQHIMQPVAARPIQEERAPTKLERKSLIAPHDTKPMQPVRPELTPEEETADLRPDNADTLLPDIVETNQEEAPPSKIAVPLLLIVTVALAALTTWLFVSEMIRLP